MTESTDTKVTWLTQEAYDRLKAELEHLSGPARIEISQRIGAARAEGDLRENGGQHAAQEASGKMEVRIQQLTQLLLDAPVRGQTATHFGVASPGKDATVRFADVHEKKIPFGSR